MEILMFFAVLIPLSEMQAPSYVSKLVMRLIIEEIVFNGQIRSDGDSWDRCFLRKPVRATG